MVLAVCLIFNLFESKFITKTQGGKRAVLQQNKNVLLDFRANVFGLFKTKGNFIRFITVKFLVH